METKVENITEAVWEEREVEKVVRVIEKVGVAKPGKLFHLTLNEDDATLLAAVLGRVSWNGHSPEISNLFWWLINQGITNQTYSPNGMIIDGLLTATEECKKYK